MRQPSIVAWRTVHSIAVALLACSALGGCSFLFVEAPPADHATRAHFTCTRSRFHPIADIVWGGSFGAAGVGVLTLRRAMGEDASTAGALIYLGIAALFGASAYDGFNDVAECRDALDQLDSRARPAMPMPYPAPYYAPGNAPAPVPEPGAAVGCLSNAHCKGGMTCVQGHCVDAAAPAPVLVPTTPAPQTPAAPVQPPPAPSTVPPATSPVAPPSHEAPVLLFPAPPPPSSSP